MRKSDVLFLIVGTNPMPNIISIINRVKEDGKVFLIHSNKNDGLFSTERIANTLIDRLSEKFEKLTVTPIEVNMQKESNMIQEIKNKFLAENNLAIELNYTGGTKLMSSTIYGYFKNRLRHEEYDIILSYLDCEKDLFIYEEKKDNKIRFTEEKIEENALYNKFNLKDIIISHGLNYHKDRKETKFEDISYKMFSNFEGMALEEKNNWVYELNGILKLKDNVQERLIEFVNKQVDCSVEELCQLELEKLIKYVIGDSLEEYFYRILSNLKEKNEIHEFIWSYQQNKTNNMAGTEIDFVISRGTKNYLLSVTLCEGEYDCEPKLYEAKTRGEQISGDETRVGFICLYNSYKKLGELIGANDKYSKDLIIAIDNFSDIENKLTEWVRR